MNGNLSPARKILSKSELLARHGRPRDHRVVFTNGCFDLMHRGHVQYLAAARDLGDALVVGLNTDASVARLKGAGRPLVPEEDRAWMLAALESVDAVTSFAEETPRALIAALMPDVLVKGGDYEAHAIPGRSEVLAAGGQVVIVPFVEGRSTTSLIERIKNSEQ